LDRSLMTLSTVARLTPLALAIFGYGIDGQGKYQ
jgi:hypothetical protein